MPAGTLVPSGKLVTPAGTQGLTGPAGSMEEVGSIKAWPAVAAPASWMLCDGSAVSRTLYSALFTVIGTAYGVGDGSTTFNLPDLRGRFLLGSGLGSGLTNRALAAKGGEETHQLTVAELASHSHIVFGIGTGVAAGGISVDGLAAVSNPGNVNSALNGSDTPHNTIPPFLVVTYIIKVSATGAATAQAPIADTTQAGLMNKVSGKTTDFVDGTNNCQDLNSVIWSTRLNSLNALYNPNFEVDQKNAGSAVVLGGNALIIDRWQAARSGTMVVNAGQTDLGSAGVQYDCIPGTNYRITSKRFRFQLKTQQASLAASDLVFAWQQVEGPQWRALSNDVHSISLLVFSYVAPLKFCIALRDQNATHSLVKLCTIPAGQANVGQLIQLPSLPKWSPSGVHTVNPGTHSYYISVALACGSQYNAPAADVWQNGNFLSVAGMDNWANSPVDSTFDISFIQHQPGPICTPFIEKLFPQNHDECLRYLQKGNEYTAPFGAVNPRYNMQVIASFPNNPFGQIDFAKPMAKNPAITTWSSTTGAINTVYDAIAPGDRGVSSVRSGSKGLQELVLTSNCTLNANGQGWVLFGWAADVGF